LLAYNCSPSFNWQAKLDAAAMKRWREELAAARLPLSIHPRGWHALNLSMFELAAAYRADGMLGYSQLQQREFSQESAGYRATKHSLRAAPAISMRLQTAISAGSHSRRDGRQHRDRAIRGTRAPGPQRVVRRGHARSRS